LLNPGTRFYFDSKNNYIYYYKLQLESNPNGKLFYVDRHLVYDVIKNKFDLFENSILDYMIKHSKIEHLDFNVVKALFGDPTEPPPSHYPRREEGL